MYPNRSRVSTIPRTVKFTKHPISHLHGVMKSRALVDWLFTQPNSRKVELSAAEVEDRGPVFRFAHESRVDEILRLSLVMSGPPLEHAHLLMPNGP